MQLLALFSVNLITGIALYIFFSLRYSRAIQKRDKGIVDAMRAISLETRMQSEEILDMATKKQESIYQLTLHAENLLSEMQQIEKRLSDKLTATPKRRRTSRKKTSASSEVAKKAASAKSSQKKTAKKKAVAESPSSFSNSEFSIKASAKPSFSLPNSIVTDSEPVESHAARLLEKLEEDHIEITASPLDASQAFRVGQLSTVSGPFSSSQVADTKKTNRETLEVPQPHRASGLFFATKLFEQTGRLLRKILGDSSGNLDHLPPMSEPSAESKPHEPFDEIYKKELKKAMSMESRQSGAEKENTLSTTALSKEFQEAKHTAELLPDFGPPSIRLAMPKENFPLKRSMSSEPLFSRPNLSRREKILILLEEGLTPNEIVERLQVSRAEVELLNRLPTKERPRRKRLST